MPRTKPAKPPSLFTPELLDEILKTHNTQEAIFGNQGIVRDLIRALTERSLQTELSHHLGYQKHQPDSKNRVIPAMGAPRRRSEPTRASWPGPGY